MSGSPVLFLLGAVALSSIGAMVVWLLSRPRKGCRRKDRREHEESQPKPVGQEHNRTVAPRIP